MPLGKGLKLKEKLTESHAARQPEGLVFGKRVNLGKCTSICVWLLDRLAWTMWIAARPWTAGCNTSSWSLTDMSPNRYRFLMKRLNVVSKFLTRPLGIKGPITREAIYEDDLLPHEKPQDDTAEEDRPSDR